MERVSPRDRVCFERNPEARVSVRPYRSVRQLASGVRVTLGIVQRVGGGAA